MREIYAKSPTAFNVLALLYVQNVNNFTSYPVITKVVLLTAVLPTVDFAHH